MIKKFIKYISVCAVLFTIINLTETEAVNVPDTKFNSSYIYFGASSSYTSAVNNTQDALNQIYTSYFDLNSDGSLKITSALSQSFIDEMHERDIKVIPFLSNHWNRTLGITALKNKTTLAAQIAAAIERYNLDGINIDLENLTYSERQDYIDFIRVLRNVLPKDKEISVAVAANPYGISTGWQGSYDYKNLSEYCDYLVIMAYDEHYETGPSGPVASLPFVEKSLQYAINNVPKEKIVLSLPFYGRIWNNGGGFPKGYGVSNKKTEEYIKAYNGAVYYDLASQTSYAKITIGQSDVKPILAGKSLAAGTYTIWYENEDTIKKMLTLVQKYNIKGTASWSLGQETKNTWDYYTLWLNGCYFEDIQNHWAKNSIFKAYKNGWVKGESSKTFSPDGSLTRAQAAVMLVRLLGLPAEPIGNDSFKDTKGHWAEAEIETARKNKIIDGIGNNLFAPDSPVTREQMAVMLYNLLDIETDNAAKPAYNDVNEKNNPWSYEAIAAVSKYGVYNGYSDGSFRPFENLTRAQMAVILERLSVYFEKS